MDKPAPRFSPPVLRPRGFSLVEVAMSIGIIAFAFVALFSLLPTGLSTFRQSIDAANENWIFQNMNSMLQTTDFSKIESLDYETSNEIYYFDEEGKFTDTEQNPHADAAVTQTRLYGVKLLVDRLQRPEGDSTESSYVIRHGWRVTVAIAPIEDPAAQKEFASLRNAAGLRELPVDSRVHTRPFVVARMDSETTN